MNLNTTIDTETNSLRDGASGLPQADACHAGLADQRTFPRSGLQGQSDECTSAPGLSIALLLSLDGPLRINSPTLLGLCWNGLLLVHLQMDSRAFRWDSKLYCRVC